MTDSFASFKQAIAERYQIERELGRGGMSVVFLAHDPRQDRPVAIKVLHAGLTHLLGTERFLQEIHAAGRLQSPHIVPIYESGEAAGVPYYVMPCAEGGTLGDRLRRESQLPIDDVIRIGLDVLAALEHAHANGIIHRDIKPDNILLQRDRVQVADFGLARIAGGSESVVESITGIAVGTPEYMSPEQVAGSAPLDARSDLYSLGCVLFALLAGRPPFVGPRPADILPQHLMAAPPDLRVLRPQAPEALVGVVARALQKQAADRYASAAAMAAELVAARRTAESASSVAVQIRDPREHEPPRPAPPAWRWGLAGVALLSGAWFLAASRTRAEPPTYRLQLVLPDSAPLAFRGTNVLGVGRSSLAISPDGSLIAYVAAVGDGTRLYTRALHDSVVRPVPNSDGAYAPFFSPDGRTIGFLTRDRLMTVSASGGVAVQVRALGEAWGAVWLPSDSILLCDRRVEVIPPTGAAGRFLDWATGCPQQLGPGTIGPGHVFSGTARRIALRSIVRTDDVEVLATDGRFLPLEEATRVGVQLGGAPVVLEGGYLAFPQPGTASALMVARFDTRWRRLREQPRAAITGLRIEAGADGVAHFALATQGTLVYASGSNELLGRVVRRRPDGRLDTLLPPTDLDRMSFTHDGRRLVARTRGANGEPRQVVYDLGTGRARALPPEYTSAIWMADGRHLLAVTSRTGGSERMTLRISADDFSVQDTAVADGSVWSVSDDGRVMLVERGESVDPWIIHRDPGGPPPQQVTGVTILSRLSHDGRWIAATTTRVSEIVLIRADDPGLRFQLSAGGGEEPLWAEGDTAIYYRYQHAWYRAGVSARELVSVAPPRKLFEGDFHNMRGYSHGLAPDGSLLLMQGSPVRSTTRLEVVTNWFGEVAALLGGTLR